MTREKAKPTDKVVCVECGEKAELQHSELREDGDTCHWCIDCCDYCGKVLNRCKCREHIPMNELGWDD